MKYIQECLNGVKLTFSDSDYDKEKNYDGCHIPSMVKVNRLINYFFINGQQQTFFGTNIPNEEKIHTLNGLKEDIEFILSRLEMIENKLKNPNDSISEYKNHPLMLDIFRYIEQCRRVLTDE